MVNSRYDDDFELWEAELEASRCDEPQPASDHVVRALDAMPIRIGMWGPSRSGKSTFLAALTSALPAVVTQLYSAQANQAAPPLSTADAELLRWLAGNDRRGAAHPWSRPHRRRRTPDAQVRRMVRLLRIEILRRLRLRDDHHVEDISPFVLARPFYQYRARAPSTTLSMVGWESSI